MTEKRKKPLQLYFKRIVILNQKLYKRNTILQYQKQTLYFAVKQLALITNTKYSAPHPNPRYFQLWTQAIYSLGYF